jgi:hypothetical protein
MEFAAITISGQKLPFQPLCFLPFFPFPAFPAFLAFLAFLLRETHPHMAVPGIHVDDFAGDSRREV